MERRTFIAGVGTAFLAGCISSPSGEDDESTATTTATPEPSPKPEPELSFSSNGAGTVRIAHYGKDNVTDEATEKVAVTVDGERVPVVHDGEEATYLLADEDALGEGETAAYNYPLSVGNVVTVSASASNTVEVVWYPENGEKQTLAEYTVPEPTATPTTEAENTTDA